MAKIILNLQDNKKLIQEVIVKLNTSLKKMRKNKEELKL